MSELMLDVGQANELKLAFRRAGYSNDEIKQLCEGNVLADVRNVLLARAEIKLVEHLINCDADPFLPNGWKVEEHQKGGQFKFDPAKVESYLSNPQRNGKSIGGHKLREELKGKPVLNACVLDYLLANPYLIPEDWKKSYIFFWGTIYRDAGGSLCVRCLCWNGDGWDWRFSWLERDWDDVGPAALRASST